MKVYLVYYFDDMNWCVDGVYKHYKDADDQVTRNKMSGMDSYVDWMEVK